MHFHHCFRFPPYFRKILLRKIFNILPFPDKFFDFHPPKFLMTFFLVIDHKFWIPLLPLFSLFQSISPPVSQKLLFPPCFRKIHLLFTCFLCISFPPYFDHDAWTPLSSPSKQFSCILIFLLWVRFLLQVHKYFRYLPPTEIFEVWVSSPFHPWRRDWLQNDSSVNLANRLKPFYPLSQERFSGVFYLLQGIEADCSNKSAAEVPLLI